MSINIFANIDKFNSEDANYSYGDLDDNDDVLEPPEEVAPKSVAKSKRGRAGRAKTKSNLIPESKPIDLDSESDDEAKVCPGVGQKTAFKKLSKLKESLAATAVTVTTRKRTRPTISSTIQEAMQQKRSKRLRPTLPETTFPVVPNRNLLSQANTMNDSFDEDELNINVKLKWEGTSRIEKMQFSMYKTFSELIGELSAREKVDAKLFFLMLGDTVIKPEDSPHSIGYTIGKFISVRIVDNPESYIIDSFSASQPNTIEVKIQYPQWKKPMICNVKLTDQFKTLCGMCAEKLKCHPNKIRFKFDGDVIPNTDTLNDQDFEGGEILDLLMSE